VEDPIETLASLDGIVVISPESTGCPVRHRPVPGVEPPQLRATKRGQRAKTFVNEKIVFSNEICLCGALSRRHLVSAHPQLAYPTRHGTLSPNLCWKALSKMVQMRLR